MNKPKQQESNVQYLYGPWDKPRAQLTDFGNAERLISKFGNILRYSYERKSWLIWKGTHWQWDMVGDIEKYAKLTVRSIYAEAEKEDDADARKLIIAHASKSESGARINAMIDLAKSEHGIPVCVSALDANPWYFNVSNGTIDVRTGELHEHKQEDLITVLVPLDYDPEALCPTWLQFLEKVTNNDTELTQYLKTIVGYSLTGDISQQVLFFLYGLGSNGKSTFITTIRKLMGSYGERTNTDLFLTKDKGNSGPREGLANLKGKRFVAASEIEDGRRLAVSLIKDLTGGETIKADRKYEHEFEYTPSFKIWLTGNHKPVITDSTLSTWRRMKLIPFTVTINPSEADVNLPQKLEKELPGILNWAIEGCQSWIEYGLPEPPVVKNATAIYRHDSDILSDFIEDSCLILPSGTVAKHNLRKAYEEWANKTGNVPIPPRAFTDRIREKGMTERKSGSVRYWNGITLAADKQEQASFLGTNTGTKRTNETHFSGTSLMRENKEKNMENGLIESQNFSTGTENWDKTKDLPDYPTELCKKCGGDWYLSEDNKWKCVNCEPEIENEELQ